MNATCPGGEKFDAQARSLGSEEFLLQVAVDVQLVDFLNRYIVNITVVKRQTIRPAWFPSGVEKVEL